MDTPGHTWQTAGARSRGRDKPGRPGQEVGSPGDPAGL